MNDQEQEEYHVYTCNGATKNVYVFRALRDNEGMAIQELWMVIEHMGQEIKIRLNLGDLAEQMANKLGGDVVPDQVDKLFEMLGDVIPTDVKIDHTIKKFERELNELTNQKISERYISAAEAAHSAHPSNLSIDEIIEQRNKNGY